MPEKTASFVEDLRKWSVTALVAILCFAGKATVRDAVREEMLPLQAQVRSLELKVAALEAGNVRRESASK